MTLRILVFAALRVFSIYLVVQVLALVPVTIEFMPSASATGTRLPILLQITAMLIASALLWSVAGHLAAKITREVDPVTLSFPVALGDAYSFAFVFLGLYFVLSSLASTLQQLYYFTAVVAQLPADDPHRSLALFQLYGPAITLLAGTISVMGARFWSRQLVAFSERMF